MKGHEFGLKRIDFHFAFTEAISASCKVAWEQTPTAFKGSNVSLDYIRNSQVLTPSCDDLVGCAKIPLLYPSHYIRILIYIVLYNRMQYVTTEQEWEWCICVLSRNHLAAKQRAFATSDVMVLADSPDAAKALVPSSRQLWIWKLEGREM